MDNYAVLSSSFTSIQESILSIKSILDMNTELITWKDKKKVFLAINSGLKSEQLSLMSPVLNIDLVTKILIHYTKK